MKHSQGQSRAPGKCRERLQTGPIPCSTTLDVAEWDGCCCKHLSLRMEMLQLLSYCGAAQSARNGRPSRAGRIRQSVVKGTPFPVIRSDDQPSAFPQGCRRGC